MQMQIDPVVPTNIPPADLDNFESLLTQVLNGIVGTSGPLLLTTGNSLWTGLAAVLVVWTGVQIAMSGTFSPMQIIKLIIGLWIPWVMLHFYENPLPFPADAYTFPTMIVEGGNWLMDMFLVDILTATRTELSNMVNLHLTRITDAWEGFQVLDLITSGSAAAMTLFTGIGMMLFTMLMLILLYCITYAQVIWAQLAVAILVLLGPLFIPWLLFEPMAFLFWGWFRSLIVFSLYGALAGAVLRVFMGVTLGYVTTYSNAVINFDLVTMGGWVLIILPLFVAGILASLKVGELASMLVTGSAVTSSGITGAAAAAASGGATAAGGAAAAGRGAAKAGGI